MKEKPNFRERAQYLISPQWGQRAYAARLKREQENQTVRQSATGYGNHGASTTLNSLVGWIVGEGSAEDDIDLQGSVLRKRSRDLYAGGGLAKSGVETMVTNVAGWGIQPKPEIDGEALGLSDEECDAWERQALREWRLWAENSMCDAEHSKTFYAMQQLAFRSQLMSGDCFALFGMEENRRTPYRLTIRILEADRVSTPDTSGDSESVDTDGGGRIVDGVEINAAGQVVRYHITNRHPLAETDVRSLEWVAVDAFGKDTGYPNILHVTGFERPEQRRGIPFVAAQIEQIKQLDRYLNSELAANVVSSMLTAFIISNEDDGRPGMEDAVNEDEKVTDDEFKIELAPGAIYDLPPGKTIKEINPLRNNAGFESFVNALIMIVGASMGVPKEVLIKKFDSNYTAARASLLDFWKRVKVERAGFNASFNQPVYEQWLSEAEPVAACADPDAYGLMRECYGRLPQEITAKAAQKEAGNTGGAAAPTVPENTTDNGNEEEGNLEINEITAQQLREGNDGVYQEIFQAGAAAERQRQQDIDALCGEGYEALAEEAKEKGTSAADFLRQMVTQQKQKKQDFLAQRQAETAASQQVRGGDAGQQGKGSEDDELKALASESAAYAKEAAGQGSQMY